jgi:hypothetical protein
MTKLSSAPASIGLLAIVLLTGCNKADTAEPRALSGDTAAADQAQRAPGNKSAAPVATPAPATTTAADGVNPQGAAALEFKKRIAAYMKIHNDADGKVPSLKKTDDPKEISDREKLLADAIMTLRAGAKPGDVFAPEYQPYFIQIVKDDFKTRSAADRKAIVVELPAKLNVDINTVYPTTVPLATFPPALLSKLPDLPPELEYRIVGRSLILRDVKANLIVDIMRDVVPTIPS